MMRRLLVAFIATVFISSPAFSECYETTFDVTEDPISQGSSWTNGEVVGLDWEDVATNSAVGGGIAIGAVIIQGFADNIAHLKTSVIAFEDDQWVEGVVFRVPGYSPSSNHEVELHLRWETTTNNARGYELLWAHQGAMAIVRWNGALNAFIPVEENIGNCCPGEAVTGDVLRFGVTGQHPNVTFSVTLNGSPVPHLDGVVDTVTGTGWDSGQPGLGFWPKGTSTLTSYGWSDWVACNDGESPDSVGTVRGIILSNLGGIPVLVISLMAMLFWYTKRTETK